MSSTIAFVGAGPTTLYTLAALLDQAPSDIQITVFEAEAEAGIGMPYRPGWNHPAMLANIASIEIPPVTETLVDWLSRQSAGALAALGIAHDQIDDRTFFSRLTLGRYYAEQFDALVDRARHAGIRIEVRTGCRVVDAVYDQDSVGLIVSPGGDFLYHQRFDFVVLATGHQWPVQQPSPGYFLSPWPASSLTALPPVEVGIRGSSLTAIDTAVAIASAHGAFVRRAGTLVYEPADDTSGLQFTLMSRKGLLPEADFYFPLPHPPLAICTAEVIERLIAAPDGDLLDAAFALFKRELTHADPAYAQANGLADATVETFAECYFAARAQADPFEWAEANLEEARRNHRDQVVVPWRYAILRMHEVIGLIAPHLDGRSFARFNQHLKPVFVDDYSSVPHESIERMLALHRAGKLEILALGDDYRIDADPARGGAVLETGDGRRHFPIFVEAMGQRPLSADQFPFPSLVKQDVIHDDVSADAPDARRGIAIDDAFHPLSAAGRIARLYCLSLPFIMGRHPFVQGITSSSDMGRIVGRDLAEALNVERQTLAPSTAQAA